MKKLLFVLMFIPLILSAQTNLDSLWRVWNDETVVDTMRLQAMSEISWQGHLFTQPDSAFYFAQMLHKLAFETGNKKWMAWALRTQGISYAVRGQYDEGLECYFRSLKIYEEIGLKKGVSNCFDAIATSYGQKGEYDNATNYYLKSLKIKEEAGDESGEGISLFNLANIYKRQGKSAEAIKNLSRALQIFEKHGEASRIAAVFNMLGNINVGQENYSNALEYFNKALKIEVESGSKKKGISILGNIGNIYTRRKEFDKALEYHFRGLKISMEIADLSLNATFNLNIGQVYLALKEYDKAFDYMINSIKMNEKMGSKGGLSRALQEMGVLYIEKGQFNKALEYLKRSYIIAKEIDDLILIRDVSEKLWEVNKILERPKESLAMYELFITTRDSILSKDNQRVLIQQEYKYEYEKEKEIADVTHQKELEKQNAIAQEEKEKQQIIIFSIAIGLILIIIFSFLIFRRLQITKKQKLIIEEQGADLAEANEELNQTNEEIAAQRDQIEMQKFKVEEAHHEVQSSINYAERIQSALLATEEDWQNVSPEHFILFRPRDVVSGDFYWAHSKGDLVFWAAADCTGHGVPGAFMSMLGVGFLNEIVGENSATDPGEILTILRNKIIKSLEQKGATQQRKDGMDIALCCINKKTNELSYSGAYNPVIVVRDINGANALNAKKTIESETHVLHDFEVDRMPIGTYAKDSVPFTTHKLMLEKGDTIYSFTDGYQDQFGGPLGKKYMVKKMKNFLLDLNSKPLVEQHDILNHEFEEWMNEGETKQIDDVCVIGVKV